MTHWKKLANQDYLGAYSLDTGQDLTVKILTVSKQEITGVGGRKEERIVATLENQKPMILNATNCKTIERLYGPFVEDWQGKQITLFASTTTMAGDVVECLRVRPTVPAIQTPKKPMASERFNQAIEAVKTGMFSVDDLLEKFDLTTEQMQTLSMVAGVAA